mmetsp:Transcript_11174/g.17274  ORF Transcript_11174/g.17274 Transcript_11174/m.17274 type:complete len:311 (+) Transcript_11174:120-1052(+)
MDTSSLFAAVGSGVIFLFFYVVSVAYLFGYDRKSNGSPNENSHVYQWTFHVESLRFYGMLNFLVVLIFGALVTEKSGIDTIQDPTETVIFNLFGINHSCNYVDHNPVRMLAAMLVLPLVQIPFMLYVVFWHSRLAKSVKTGKSPKWLLNLSRVLSPFNFIAMSQLHLWFVNNPDDIYGFTAHYIPYVTFQFAFCLIKLLNLIYLTKKGELPWGIPLRVAEAYVGFFFGLTILYTVFVSTTIAGIPFIKATDGDAELLFTNSLSYSWGAMAIFGTLVLSGKERFNGDDLTLTLGELESSQKDEEYGATRNN